MKKTIRTYINTLLLFLIPFVVISLILPFYHISCKQIHLLSI